MSDTTINGDMKARRAEALRSALNCFWIARMSLSQGKLSESERLIRFYEGVALSLEREEDVFSEARGAFESVFRFALDDSPSSGDPSSYEAMLLRLQARYNLAVLSHRRWLHYPPGSGLESPEFLSS